MKTALIVVALAGCAVEDDIVVGETSDAVLTQNPTLVWSGHWNPGWTSVERLYDYSVESSLIVYNASSGMSKVVSLTAHGSGPTVRFTDNWGSGFTSITADHWRVLAYDANSGRARIKSEQSSWSTVYSGTWTSGWTAFTAVDTPPFILSPSVDAFGSFVSYKRASGDVDFDFFGAYDGGSVLDSTIANHKFHTGYTSMLTRGYGNVILVYNRADGTAKYVDVTDPLNFHILLTDTWHTGWDIVTNAPIGQPGTTAPTYVPGLLVYRTSSGAAKIVSETMDENYLPTGIHTEWEGDLPSGYSDIVSFCEHDPAFDNMTHGWLQYFLAYKADSGDVDIYQYGGPLNNHYGLNPCYAIPSG